MHRSVIMHMKRYAGEEPLRRFDSNMADVMQDLTIAWSMTGEWARTVNLNDDPAMPFSLRNRPADNWRHLSRSRIRSVASGRTCS